MDKRFDPDRACSYIEDAASLGSRPGLERIAGLCDKLGNPQDDLSFIHIAGTNGKGSTACFIASVLSQSGLRVGSYTSPAVDGIMDHYRINGELILPEDYAACVSAVAAANEELRREKGDGATQFELETAVAFIYFLEKKCDVVLLECGMGGRDDATNIVRNKLCCIITSISFDHMQYLGDTLGKIADAKAGIIRSGLPVIAADEDPEVTEVIRKRCERTGSSLYLVSPSDVSYNLMRQDKACGSSQHMMVDYGKFRDIEIGLAGTYQAVNAALAVKTVSVIDSLDLIPGHRISEDHIREGMKKAKWPYRFECISTDPKVFVDGAHNADAAKKLGETISVFLKDYRIILILGMFADKEYDKVAAYLAGQAEKVYTVQTPDNARALSAEGLAECVKGYCSNVYPCESIQSAYLLAAAAVRQTEREKGCRAAIVACGSLSYLHELSRIVKKEADNGIQRNGQGQQDTGQ